MASQVEAQLQYFYSLTPEQQKRQLILWLEYCMQRQQPRGPLAGQVWYVAEEAVEPQQDDEL